MFRCWKPAKKANVNIKLQGDHAVVSYSIDPRHSQTAEVRFKLVSGDVANSIITKLQKEVGGGNKYNLIIKISSPGRRDSTEQEDIDSQEVSEVLDTFITAQLNAHLRKHNKNENTKSCCAIL